jgi:phage gpG-like protein
MITIEVDDRRVLDVLNALLARLDDLTPVMQTVGEYLVGSTKRRFATSIGPDGVRWAPNSEVTYLRMIEKAHGVTLTKGEHAGKLNAKGAGMAASKKPLIGETHRLSSEISAQADRDSVEVGSPMVYAAVQQFGASKGAFGRNRRNGPIPWGDIPARPFLGLSEADADQVLAIVGEHLASAAE